MNVKKIISSVGVCAVGFLLAAGFEYAGAWTGPGNNTPPSGNVSAPINASANAQAKSGNLALGTSTTQSSVLDVEGTGYIQGLIVGTAFQLLPNAGVGKVLVSDAQGYASWTATSTLGIVASSTTASTTYTLTANAQTFTSSGSWKAPAGVTQVTVQAYGAGGGAGGARTGNSGCYLAGQGGSAGAYVQALVTVVPGQSYSVSIGTGGSGANAVNASTCGASVTPSWDGSSGGSTSFGSYVTAGGGNGGWGGNSGSNNAPTGDTAAYPNISGGTGTISGTATGFTIQGSSVPGNSAGAAPTSAGASGGGSDGGDGTSNSAGGSGDNGKLVVSYSVLS